MKTQKQKQLQRKRAKFETRRIAASANQSITFEATGKLEIVAATDKVPTVSLEAYNGGKLRLANFPYPVIVDTSGVKAMSEDQLPILRDHDQKRPLGHGTPTIEATRLLHTGVFSHEGEERDKVIQAQANGFRWQASIGGTIPNRQKNVKTIPPGQAVKVNGRTHTGPVHVVQAFQWNETSVVALGADEDRASASVAAAHNQKRLVLMNDFEKWLQAAGIDAANMSDDQIATLKAAFEAKQKQDEIAAAGGDKGTKDGKGDGKGTKGGKGGKGTKRTKRLVAAGGRTDDDSDDDDLDDDGDDDNGESDVKAFRAELRRSRRIDSIFASYKGDMKPEALERLRQRTEDGEISEDRARLELLQSERNSVQASGYADFSVGGGNGAPPVALVLEAAACRTAGLSDEQIEASFDGQPAAMVERILDESTGHRYQNIGIRALIHAACRQAGHSSFNGEIGNEEIEVALVHSQRAGRIHAASGGSSFSTISVPGILGGVARRAMLAAYDEVNSAGVIMQIASITSTSDFKKFERYRMTETGVMAIVPPTGEVKHTSVTEEKYENKVDTYGRLIGLSRHMMVNDEMGAFLQVPRMLGRQGRHSLEQIGITKLVNAPTIATAGTTEFFHGAARGNQTANYIEGADTALSIDSVGEAYQLFLDQVDSDGKPVLMEPGILLTTTKNAVVARKIFADAEFRYEDGTGKQFINNQWKGMFRPISSAYLGRLGTVPNADQWYLLATPTEDVGIIQVAFLNNRRTPVIEQGEMNLNVLGVTWRGIFDFGFALQDPRAGVKSKGKA